MGFIVHRFEYLLVLFYDIQVSIVHADIPLYHKLTIEGSKGWLLDVQLHLVLILGIHNDFHTVEKGPLGNCLFFLHVLLLMVLI